MRQLEAEPRKVLLYAREPDPAAQLWQLRSYAKRQGWSIAGEFAEAVPVGAKRVRPEFRRLVESLRSGTVAGGVVLTPSLSTIFDSLPQLIATVDDMRIRSVSLSTLSSPAEIDEQFRISVRALVHFQQDIRGGRIQRGLNEARRAGKPVGRKRLQDVPIERARALIAAGKGLRETARILGLAPSTLHRKLKQSSTSVVETQGER